jgi:uncharacterized protein YcfL
MKNLTLIIGLISFALLTSCSSAKESNVVSKKNKEVKEQEYVVVHIKDSKEFFLIPKTK